MYKMISLLTIPSFFLTSCCSMICDPTRQVTVTAQQSDVEVFIDGYACGTAPLLVDLDKTCNHTIIVSKLGYQSQRACLKSHHTLKSASNIITPIAGAIVGTGIGLIAYGSGSYILPYCIIGTMYGVAIGLGLGVVGTVADLYLRSDCDLDTKGMHFNLS